MVPDPSASVPRPELEPFDALSHAWRALLAQPGPVLLGSAAVVAAGALVSWAAGTLAGTGIVARVCWLVVVLASWHVLASLVAQASLDQVRGEGFDLRRAARRLPPAEAVLTALVVAAMTTAGTVLCVVPGVAVALLTGFTPFLVAAERLGPVDAVRRSADLVVRHLGDVVTLMLLTVGVLLAGAMVLCVGVVVALPLVYLAWAYAYAWFTGTLPDEAAAGH